MSDLAVIVPSRGRPQNIERLWNAFQDTEADAELIVAFDTDDPKFSEYVELCERLDITYWNGPRKRLGPWLNHIAPQIADDYFAIGFMGDDHLPRSKHWDRTMLDALRELGTGIVYGDDLLQGRNLPTEACMTSDIIQTLGYMSMPKLTHMWIDNFWMDIAIAIDRLKYLPDVVIEHLHPTNGKSDEDAGYVEVNEFMNPDEIAYGNYKRDGSFDRDIEKLEQLIGVK